MKLFNNIKEKITILKSSNFFLNILAAIMGVAGAQAVTFLCMPLITRLYKPEDFGLLAIFTAIVNMLAPVATMSYANAVVIPQNNKDAFKIAKLSVLCCLLFSPVLFILIIIFQEKLIALISINSQDNYIFYLIPIATFFGAFLYVAEQISIRYEIFKSRAKAFFISAVLMNFMKIIGGLVISSGMVLVSTFILGKICNLIILNYSIRKKGFFFEKSFGKNGILDTAIKHKDFPFYRLPQGIINGVTLGLPVIIITTHFGKDAAGQYSLAILCLGAPVMLLGQTVGDVLYPRITRAILNKQEDPEKLFYKVTFNLFFIALFVFSPIFFFGGELFSILFGEQWVKAGQYSQWLCLWMIGTLATRGCIAAIPALNLQRFFLIYECISLFLRTSILYLGFKYLGSDENTIAVYSLLGLLLSLILFIFIALVIRNIKR